MTNSLVTFPVRAAWLGIDLLARVTLLGWSARSCNAAAEQSTRPVLVSVRHRDALADRRAALADRPSSLPVSSRQLLRSAS